MLVSTKHQHESANEIKRWMSLLSTVLAIPPTPESLYQTQFGIQKN